MYWRSSQLGTVLIAVFSLYLVIGVLIISIIGDYSVEALLIFVVVPVVVLLLSYRLDVSVDDKVIRVKMGVGLIYKKIRVSDVQDIKPVKNSLFAGWGVRILPEYTMYNVTGDKAIEITFKDRKRKFRVGMDNPTKFVDSFYANFKS